MYDEIIKLTGPKPGLSSMVLVGVHGDERSGIIALEKILPGLKIERGEVCFGYGNPKAIEANTRFIESNLNRLFKPEDQLTEKEKSSYEFSRAKFLKQYLDKADALLDVHCSFTPKSQSFLICEPNSREVTNLLPIPTLVYGFDAVEPGGSDYYMNTNEKVGICVETGYLGDPKSTIIAEQCIYAFLRAQNHIKGTSTQTFRPTVQNSIVMYQLYLNETDDFKLIKMFDDFEFIKAGQQIGLDGTKAVTAPKDSIILFARDRSQVGEEAFLLGEKLYK